MTRRGVMGRTVAMAWAALQLLSPGASAIAHAMGSIESAGAAAIHVEATGSTSCPQAHSPDCGLCRSLTAGGEPASAAELVPFATTVRQPFGGRVAPAVAADGMHPQGRAPPLTLT